MILIISASAFHKRIAKKVRLDPGFNPIHPG
jgi:hypothetical protein